MPPLPTQNLNISKTLCARVLGICALGDTILLLAGYIFCITPELFSNIGILCHESSSLIVLSVDIVVPFEEDGKTQVYGFWIIITIKQYLACSKNKCQGTYCRLE